MTCPRCGSPMKGGLCDECGFPLRKNLKKFYTMKHR